MECGPLCIFSNSYLSPQGFDVLHSYTAAAAYDLYSLGHPIPGELNPLVDPVFVRFAWIGKVVHVVPAAGLGVDGNSSARSISGSCPVWIASVLSSR